MSSRKRSRRQARALETAEDGASRPEAHPTPSVSVSELRGWDSNGVEPGSGRAARRVRWRRLRTARAARRPIPHRVPRLIPDTGGVVLIGKAPHSKCGVRKHLGVRVPPPPLRTPPFRSMTRRRATGESHFHGAWLSPVERCVRVAEVPGSNPGAPITKPRIGPHEGRRPGTGGRVA